MCGVLSSKPPSPKPSAVPPPVAPRGQGARPSSIPGPRVRVRSFALTDVGRHRRSNEDAYFRDELTGLDASPGVAVTWIYTRRTPDGWQRPAGRLDASDLGSNAFEPGVRPAVYVCGPTGFVEAAARALVGIGHDTQRIKTERFGGT